MSTAGKILKKMKLGDAASRLLSPLAKDGAPLPTEEEALAALSSLSPDPGQSCLVPPCPPAPALFDVDVIIPVYNVAPYLGACLDSVLGQKTDCRFRVIAVDDGSTDGSGALLDSITDARLTVVHQANRGHSGARNAAVARSQARYLLFLDADDLLAPDALDTLWHCVRKSGAALAVGAYHTMDLAGSPIGIVPQKAGPLDPRRDCSGYVWGKLYRRDLLDGLCLPEGYWYEDSLLAQVFFPLLEARREAVLGVDETVYLYRINPRGISHTGRGQPKSLDSLWITLQLHRDRQTLGLENDQTY